MYLQLLIVYNAFRNFIASYWKRNAPSFRFYPYYMFFVANFEQHSSWVQETQKCLRDFSEITNFVPKDPGTWQQDDRESLNET